MVRLLNRPGPGGLVVVILVEGVGRTLWLLGIVVRTSLAGQISPGKIKPKIARQSLMRKTIRLCDAGPY